MILPVMEGNTLLPPWKMPNGEGFLLVKSVFCVNKARVIQKKGPELLLLWTFFLDYPKNLIFWKAVICNNYNRVCREPISL